MKKHPRSLILLCAFCIILMFVACNHQEEYHPSAYSKEEVQCLYHENLELFERLVKVISSNDAFYEKGRINEYTDADIVSPYDDALSLFNDADKKRLMSFLS